MTEAGGEKLSSSLVKKRRRRKRSPSSDERIPSFNRSWPISNSHSSLQDSSWQISFQSFTCYREAGLSCCCSGAYEKKKSRQADYIIKNIFI